MQGSKSPNKKQQQVKRCKSLEKREVIQRNGLKRLNHKNSLVDSELNDAPNNNTPYKEIIVESNYQELNTFNKNNEKNLLKIDIFTRNKNKSQSSIYSDIEPKKITKRDIKEASINKIKLDSQKQVTQNMDIKKSTIENDILQNKY